MDGIKIGDILTLGDNNEYCVVDIIENINTTYIYLVDLNNNSNIIWGKIEDDYISEISDPDELEKVILQIKNHLNDSQHLAKLFG